MSDFEFELFPGKDLSGLFKDIYDNQTNKKARISELIADVRKIIRNSSDMAMLAPVITDLVKTSISNDDALIKLATIAQRIMASKDKGEGDVGFLTEKEKQQLLKDLESTAHKAQMDLSDELDTMTSEVPKKIKKKINS